MGPTEVILTLLALVAGILATAGYASVSVSPADFRTARFCFIAAAICLGGTAVVWGFSSVQPLWARVMVTAIIGAVAASGLTEGLRWLADREAYQNQPAQAPATAIWFGEQVQSAPKPQLSPGEKDRLGNTIYELSEILHKSGEPLVVQTNDVINHRLAMQPSKIREKLAVVNDNAREFYDAIFQKFVPDHQFYQREIYQIIQNDYAPNIFRLAVNDYMVTIDSLADIDPNMNNQKAQPVLNLPTKDLAIANNNLNLWLQESFRRIAQMRASLL